MIQDRAQLGGSTPPRAGSVRHSFTRTVAGAWAYINLPTAVVMTLAAVAVDSARVFFTLAAVWAATAGGCSFAVWRTMRRRLPRPQATTGTPRTGGR